MSEKTMTDGIAHHNKLSGLSRDHQFMRITEWANMLERRVAELDPNYRAYQFGRIDPKEKDKWRPTLHLRCARKKFRSTPYLDPDSMRYMVFQQYWEHLTFNSPGSYVHDGTGEWRDIPVVDDKESDAIRS